MLVTQLPLFAYWRCDSDANKRLNNQPPEAFFFYFHVVFNIELYYHSLPPSLPACLLATLPPCQPQNQ